MAVAIQLHSRAERPPAAEAQGPIKAQIVEFHDPPPLRRRGRLGDRKGGPVQIHPAQIRALGCHGQRRLGGLVVDCILPWGSTSAVRESTSASAKKFLVSTTPCQVKGSM